MTPDCPPRAALPTSPHVCQLPTTPEDPTDTPAPLPQAPLSAQEWSALHWDIWQEDQDPQTTNMPMDSPTSPQDPPPPDAQPARTSKSRRLRSQTTMEMYFPTINTTTTQPSASRRPPLRQPNNPSTRDVITTITANSTSTSPPTTYNATNIHPHTPSINSLTTCTDPHHVNRNSPPSTTHTNQQYKPTHHRKPLTNIMHYILQRRTDTLIHAPASLTTTTNNNISSNTNNTPSTTNPTNACHPTPTNQIPSITNQHHTATNRRPNLNSQTFTIKDATTNPTPNSTTSTINAIHNCQPTAPALTINLNSTPFTDNETTDSQPSTINAAHNCHSTATDLTSNLHSTPSTDNATNNSHPSAMCTMDTSLYSLNPLSTPTPDCEAVPDSVG